MEKSKRIAKRLSILWLVTLLVLGVLVNVYETIAVYKGNASAISILSPLHVAVSLVTALYFYPLLYLIRHHAKQAQMKKLAAVALAMIFFFSAWLLLNLGATVYTLL